MDTTSRPRVAIVGTGFIGSVHVRSARLAGAEVVGVAASTPERSEQQAHRLGVERAYDSAEAAVRDDSLDAVHVCTPNDLHGPLTLAALESGLHVVCEKPVATSSADARRVREEATRTGRVVAVPFVYRYHAMVRQAREMVRRGEIGTVRLVHGTYLQDWLMDDAATNWRVDATRGGSSRAFAPGRTTEDAVVADLSTEAGAMGSVVVSQVSPGRRNRLWLEVDGSERSVTFWQEEPNRLSVGGRDGTWLVERDSDALHADAARLSLVPSGHPQGYLDCFDAFVADAYAAMRGERPEGLPTIDDGVRAVELTEQVMRACEAAERSQTSASGGENG